MKEEDEEVWEVVYGSILSRDYDILTTTTTTTTTTSTTPSTTTTTTTTNIRCGGVSNLPACMIAYLETGILS